MASEMDYGASYRLAGVAFQRALASIYAIAFPVALCQFRALHGEHGLENDAPTLPRATWFAQRRHLPHPHPPAPPLQ